MHLSVSLWSPWLSSLQYVPAYQADNMLSSRTNRYCVNKKTKHISTPSTCEETRIGLCFRKYEDLVMLIKNYDAVTAECYVAWLLCLENMTKTVHPQHLRLRDSIEYSFRLSQNCLMTLSPDRFSHSSGTEDARYVEHQSIQDVICISGTLEGKAQQGLMKGKETTSLRQVNASWISITRPMTTRIEHSVWEVSSFFGNGQNRHSEGKPYWIPTTLRGFYRRTVKVSILALRTLVQNDV